MEAARAGVASPVVGAVIRAPTKRSIRAHNHGWPHALEEVVTDQSELLLKPIPPDEIMKILLLSNFQNRSMFYLYCELHRLWDLCLFIKLSIYF